MGPGTLKKLLADHIYIILLSLITLLALGLRLYRLGSDSLWLDEAFSVVISQGDNLQHIIELTNNDIHPPLYYLILHFFLKLQGPIEVTARLISVIFGVLLVPAVYYVGMRLFDKRTALVASFLCAISIAGITYSQEARMYAMVAFIAVIEIYAFYRAITENRRIYWAIFSLSAILIIYTHYYGLILTMSLVAYGLAVLLRESVQKKSFRISGAMIYFAISLALIFLVFLPQMVVMIHQSTSSMANSEVHPNNLLFFPKIYYFLSVGGIENPTTYLTVILAVIFMTLAAAGVYISIAIYDRKHNAVLLFLITVLALSSIAGFVMTYKVRFCGYRYFLFLLGPYLLMVAYGITALPGFVFDKIKHTKLKGGQVSREIRKNAGRLVPLSIVSMVLLISLIGASSYPPVYSGSNVDLRDAIQFVKDNAMPGDKMVIMNSDNISRDFYAGYLGMEDRMVNVSGDEEIKSIVPGEAQWVIVSDDRDWPENEQIRPWLDENMKRKANMTLVSVYGTR